MGIQLSRSANILLPTNMCLVLICNNNFKQQPYIGFVAKAYYTRV